MLTTLSDNITTNGLYSYNPPTGYDGFSSAEINVNVSSLPNLTPGSATITTNGTTEYNPPANADGFSSFTVTTNVPSQPAVNDFDAISVYYSDTGDNYILIETISYDDPRWIISNYPDYDILPGYTFIKCERGYLTVGSNLVSYAQMWVNASSSSALIGNSIGNAYMTFPTYQTFTTGGRFIITLNQNNDPRVYSNVSTALGTRATAVQINTDEEDLDLFLNRQ